MPLIIWQTLTTLTTNLYCYTILLCCAPQVAVEPVLSFGLDGSQRTALVVRKAQPTPAKFPRAAGTPAKTPL